ncbi:MAG TPA: LysR substrate-binding domain-containing protein [Phenylobacterium sp.]|jgi:LysR family glycine cleavage system transcriptional activator
MSDPLSNLPLSAIRVFEAAARLLSFTRAAEELGITQAAVSWQVKALERRLDQPLFRRLPREVALTPAGERLGRAATEAIGLLRGALSDISDSGDGVLAISTMQTMATQWLAPRLGGFQLAHPKIAVRLESSSQIVDLSRDGFDVALRSGQGDWPGLDAVALFPSLMTALCAPAVAEQLDRALGPASVLEAPRIGLESEWALWLEAAGVTIPSSTAQSPPAPRFAAEAQTTEIAAALAGQGLALASPIMFAPEIDAGRLVQPFPVTVHLQRQFWLVYPSERRRAAEVAAFRDWLLACVEEDPSIARYAADGAAAAP